MSLTTNYNQVIFEIVNIDKFCGAAACTTASATRNNRCVMEIGSLSAPGQYLILSTEITLNTVACYRNSDGILLFCDENKFECWKHESGDRITSFQPYDRTCRMRCGGRKRYLESFKPSEVLHARRNFYHEKRLSPITSRSRCVRQSRFWWKQYIQNFTFLNRS